MMNLHTLLYLTLGGLAVVVLLLKGIGTWAQARRYRKHALLKKRAISAVHWGNWGSWE